MGNYDGGSSLYDLLGDTVASRRSFAGGAAQSIREYYRDLRQMGASKQEARRLAKEYAANTTRSR